MANRFSSEPKGFRSTAMTNIPYKDGSVYTAGTYKGRLTNTGKGRFDGWLLYKTTPYSQTGKKITLDFACFAGPLYFDYTGSTSVKIHIRFYSVITGRFDDNWYKLGEYSINKTGASLPTAGNNYGADSEWSMATMLYNNYYNYGSYKPAAGVTHVNGVNPADHSTYASYVNACIAANGSPTVWDGDQGVKAFVGVLPFGVRYISNNGNWSKSRKDVNPDGVTGGSYRVVKPSSWGQANEDGGNNPNSYKTFTIDENLIARAHGTVTGVTAFQLRFEVYSNDVFYFPSGWFDNWVMIDNPQLGLLDWSGDKRSADGSYIVASTNWPERFDAKAYIMTNSGKKEIAARYNSGGNGSQWTLF